MHCLRKTALVFLIVSMFSPLFVTPVKADYTSISLSPTTGFIYSDTTAVSVYINSGSDEFVGVDINLGFTGSVQYLSATGAARCSSFQVTPGSGTLNIECFSTQHDTGETYNGVLATLYFKSTASSGSSTFTFTSVDPNVTSKGTATYTLTSTENPNAGQGGGSTSLPDSGLFDDSRGLIAVGGVLIFLGFFWDKVLSFGTLFLGKMQNMNKERAEKKVENRRSKLEKGF